jgi:hypothetical protein
VDQVEQLFEEQQVLPGTQTGADHHAVELPCANDFIESLLRGLAGIDQIALDLIAERSHLLRSHTAGCEGGGNEIHGRP